MLDDLKRSFARRAIGVDWEHINKNDLFNLYIKHEDDEDLKEKYFSAIVLRYWYLIFTNYERSKGSVEIETCYEWLTGAVMSVLKRRAWTKPDSTVYNDPNGPDKCLNMSVCSFRQGFYQASNTDKKKTNFNLVSSDELYEQFGDSSEAVSIEDSSCKESPVNSLIQSLISDGKIMEAIVLDNIAYQDSFKERKSKQEYDSYDEEGNKHTEKYTKVTQTFSLKILNKSLKNLDNYYINYFSSSYDTDSDCIINYIKQIKDMSSTQLSKLVTNTILTVKNDTNLLGMLYAN